VTASVNPNQSTGRPAGCKACGLFFLETRCQVAGVRSQEKRRRGMEHKVPVHRIVTKLS
jgi:hypothetical protein